MKKKFQPVFADCAILVNFNCKMLIFNINMALNSKRADMSKNWIYLVLLYILAYNLTKGFVGRLRKAQNNWKIP
jgi:hypothetical protein